MRPRLVVDRDSEEAPADLLTNGALTDEAGLKVLRGQAGARPVAVLKTEIGAAGFADKLRAHLTSNQYAALVVIGLAGALDPQLRTGDVVIYDRCLSETNETCLCCAALLSEQLLETLRAQGLNCRRGTGLLMERVIIEAQHKLALHQRTQAVAVDMESYLVLAAADSIPCAVVRVVMDEAASDLPDFNAGLDATGQVRLAPTLWALAARPRATLQFLRSLRPALHSLERAAHAVLHATASR